MRLSRTVTAALSAILSATLFAPAAYADAVDPATDSNVTAADVASTLDSAGVTGASDSVNTASDANSAAVANVGGTKTDIPKDASDGVSVTSKTGQTLTITPQGADDAAAGRIVDPGVVAYPNDNGSATAVQTESNGSTRFLTVIANRKAPTRYSFDVSMPEGGKLVPTADGGVMILDGNREPLSAIQPPWAKDARDRSIPTHYVINGSTLTQVVNHRRTRVAYPVTADPRVNWASNGVYLYLNRTETHVVAVGGGAVVWAYFGWTGIAGGAMAALIYAADRAVAAGYCLAYWKGYWSAWAFSTWLYRC